MSNRELGQGSPLASKQPQLAEALQELDKATEVIRNSIMVIYEELRLSSPPETVRENRASAGSLIGERIDTILGFREKLYNLNSYLEEIHAAVREI